MKAPLVTLAVLVCSLSLVVTRSAQADHIVFSTDSHFAHVDGGHFIRVDDGRDGGDEGGDGDGWFPLWFGFHYFAPRPPVIVQREYYPPPPPPPQPTYYYYCRRPEGYYPRIPNCPSGWMRVVPSGPDGPDGPP